jgi:hypothetical protein
VFRDNKRKFPPLFNAQGLPAILPDDIVMNNIKIEIAGKTQMCDSPFESAPLYIPVE